jgi:hypothetical protein
MRFVPRAPFKLASMAEAASTESITARLAHVRDGLKLLADYL